MSVARHLTTKDRLLKNRLVLSVFIASILALPSPQTRATAAAAAPKRIEVVASRFTYSPAVITLKKGEPVVLVISSKDVAHGVHFKELNLNVKTSKGGSAELPFTPSQTGDFVGHCSVFCGSGHGAMTLTLHVVD